MGEEDAEVQNGINKVSTAIDLLYQNYSKEAVRSKNGGELTAQEKAEFAKIIQRNKTIQSKLNGLEKKFANDPRMLKN